MISLKKYLDMDPEKSRPADAAVNDLFLVVLESYRAVLLAMGNSGARACADVVEPGQAEPAKAGPCVRFAGLEAFVRLRAKLDGCLTGARLAKDRAADALTKVMVPEALDYPV